MIDNTMRFKLLPAYLVIENFIQGEDLCNYEKYLLELLNKSKWFGENHPGTFISPLTECNGECDANNEGYCLDFKLFASKTALQSRNLFSSQINKLENGAIVYGGSKSPNDGMCVTRLFAAFRYKTIEELEKIRSSQEKTQGVDDDIKTALKSLEKKKNLLLFFPYQFYFDVSHTWDEAIESITSALDNDFQTAFKYRNKKTSKLDTFLTCIYDDCFLLFKVEDEHCILVETIPTDDIMTFSELSIRYSYW